LYFAPLAVARCGPAAGIADRHPTLAVEPRGSYTALIVRVLIVERAAPVVESGPSAQASPTP
jgi:hypothetical protein